MKSTIKVLMAVVAFWATVSSTFGATDIVTLRWTWMPPDSGLQPELYAPYVCFGVCDESSPWLAGVEFGIDGCQIVGNQVICTDQFSTSWPVGETWSFAMRSGTTDGQRSALSNIVVMTRDGGPVTTTTTTLPLTLQPPVMVQVEIVSGG